MKLLKKKIVPVSGPTTGEVGATGIKLDVKEKKPFPVNGPTPEKRSWDQIRSKV